MDSLFNSLNLSNLNDQLKAKSISDQDAKLRIDELCARLELVLRDQPEAQPSLVRKCLLTVKLYVDNGYGLPAESLASLQRIQGVYNDAISSKLIATFLNSESSQNHTAAVPVNKPTSSNISNLPAPEAPTPQRLQAICKDLDRFVAQQDNKSAIRIKLRDVHHIAVDNPDDIDSICIAAILNVLKHYKDEVACQHALDIILTLLESSHQLNQKVTAKLDAKTFEVIFAKLSSKESRPLCERILLRLVNDGKTFPLDLLKCLVETLRWKKDEDGHLADILKLALRNRSADNPASNVTLLNEVMSLLGEQLQEKSCQHVIHALGYIFDNMKTNRQKLKEAFSVTSQQRMLESIEGYFKRHYDSCIHAIYSLIEIADDSAVKLSQSVFDQLTAQFATLDKLETQRAAASLIANVIVHRNPPLDLDNLYLCFQANPSSNVLAIIQALGQRGNNSLCENLIDALASSARFASSTYGEHELLILKIFASQTKLAQNGFRYAADLLINNESTAVRQASFHLLAKFAHLLPSHEQAVYQLERNPADFELMKNYNARGHPLNKSCFVHLEAQLDNPVTSDILNSVLDIDKQALPISLVRKLASKIDSVWNTDLLLKVIRQGRSPLPVDLADTLVAQCRLRMSKSDECLAILNTLNEVLGRDRPACVRIASNPANRSLVQATFAPSFSDVEATREQARITAADFFVAAINADVHLPRELAVDLCRNIPRTKEPQLRLIDALQKQWTLAVRHGSEPISAPLQLNVLLKTVETSDDPSERLRAAEEISRSFQAQGHLPDFVVDGVKRVISDGTRGPVYACCLKIIAKLLQIEPNVALDLNIDSIVHHAMRTEENIPTTVEIIRSVTLSNGHLSTKALNFLIRLTAYRDEQLSQQAAKCLLDIEESVSKVSTPTGDAIHAYNNLPACRQSADVRRSLQVLNDSGMSLGANGLTGIERLCVNKETSADEVRALLGSDQPSIRLAPYLGGEIDQDIGLVISNFFNKPQDELPAGYVTLPVAKAVANSEYQNLSHLANCDIGELSHQILLDDLFYRLGGGQPDVSEDAEQAAIEYIGLSRKLMDLNRTENDKAALDSLLVYLCRSGVCRSLRDANGHLKRYCVECLVKQHFSGVSESNQSEIGDVLATWDLVDAEQFSRTFANHNVNSLLKIKALRGSRFAPLVSAAFNELPTNDATVSQLIRTVQANDMSSFLKEKINAVLNPLDKSHRLLDLNYSVPLLSQMERKYPSKFSEMIDSILDYSIDAASTDFKGENLRQKLKLDTVRPNRLSRPSHGDQLIDEPSGKSKSTEMIEPNNNDLNLPSGNEPNENKTETVRNYPLEEYDDSMEYDEDAFNDDEEATADSTGSSDLDNALATLIDIGSRQQTSSQATDGVKDLDTLFAELAQLNAGIDTAALRDKLDKIDSHLAGGINNWSKGQVLSWAQSQSAGSMDLLYAMAVLRRANILDSGKDPRAVQVCALLLMLAESKGSLAQISTGEGKTMIVSMLAVIKALQGKKVDVITSSPVLAERDAKEKASFYSLFGLSIGDNVGEAGSNAYTSQILYGSISNFQFDYLRDQHQVLGTRRERPFDIVIADEVDSMLIDEGSKIAMLSDGIPGMEYLQVVLVAVWSSVNTFLFGYQRDPSSGTIAFFNPTVQGEQTGIVIDPQTIDEHIKEHVTKAIKEQFFSNKGDSKYAIPKNLYEYAESQVEEWVAHAIIGTQLVEGKDYLVKNEQILPVDYSNTGVIQNNTQWQNGLHQYLQMKHNVPLTAESFTTSFISNVAFFKLYGSNVYGLTGTLGSQSAKGLLAKTYDVNCITIPTFKRKQFIELTAKVVAGRGAWLSSVCSSTQLELSRGRAVLIICEAINDVKEIEAQLGSRGVGNLKSYFDDSLKVEIEQVGPGSVIIATNLAGRGTDIKTSSEVEMNGGLHVCLTFLPSNLRVEEQAFGRTARQGQKGTGQLILCSDSEDAAVAAHLPMEAIKDARDVRELGRLDHIENTELKALQLKDEMFLKTFMPYAAELKRSNADKYVRRAIEERWGLFYSALDLKGDFSHGQIVGRFQSFMSELKAQFPDSVVRNHCYYTLQGNHLLINRPKAIEKYNKAIELDPVFAYAAYYNKACAIVKEAKSGYIETALECLEKTGTILDDTLLPQMQAIAAVCQMAGKQTDGSTPKHDGDGGEELTGAIKQVNNKYAILKFHSDNVKKAVELIRNRNTKNDIVVDTEIYLHDIYPDNDPKNKPPEREIIELASVGIIKIFTLKEKPPTDWLGIICVFVIAAVELAAGAVCMAVGLVNVGSVLISQGVGDVIEGIRAAATGDFNWSDYLKEKAISLAVDITCMGASKIKSLIKGASAAKTTGKAAKMPRFAATQAEKQMGRDGLKLAGQTIGKEFVQQGAVTLLNMATNLLTEEFLKLFEKEIEAKVKAVLSTKLNKATITEVVKSKEASVAMMQAAGDILDKTNEILEIAEKIMSGIAENKRQSGKAGLIASNVMRAESVVHGIVAISTYTNNFCDSLNSKLAGIAVTNPQEGEVTDKLLDQYYDEWARSIRSKLVGLMQGKIIGPTQNRFLNSQTSKFLNHMQRKYTSTGLTVDEKTDMFKNKRTLFREAEQYAHLHGNEPRKMTGVRPPSSQSTRLGNIGDVAVLAGHFKRPIEIYDANRKAYHVVGKHLGGEPIKLVYHPPTANSNGHWEPFSGPLPRASGKNSCLFDSIAHITRAHPLKLRDISENALSSPEAAKITLAARNVNKYPTAKAGHSLEGGAKSMAEITLEKRELYRPKRSQEEELTAVNLEGTKLKFWEGNSLIESNYSLRFNPVGEQYISTLNNRPGNRTARFSLLPQPREDQRNHGKQKQILTLHPDGQLRAYYCPYLQNTQDMDTLRQTQVTVPKQGGKIPYVVTGNFSGCSFILAVGRDDINVYHDSKPTMNAAAKHKQLNGEGRRIIRVDHAEEAPRIHRDARDAKFEQHTYSSVGRDSGAHQANMMMVFDNGKWNIVVQHTTARFEDGVGILPDDRGRTVIPVDVQFREFNLGPTQIIENWY